LLTKTYFVNDQSNTAVFHSIENEIRSFQFGNIPPERKTILQPLIDFIKRKVDKEQEIRLNFICTHNSRRSHLSQVWAQTAATHFHVKRCFAIQAVQKLELFPMAAKTLEQAGFEVRPLKVKTQHKKYEADAHQLGFSKTYDDSFNPQSAFAAILTCSQADGPFLLLVLKRIQSLLKTKAFDNTPQQEKYREEASNRYGAFLCILKIKKICPQLIALLH
jgi:arsenate reductase